MYVLLENQAEIRKAQTQLERTLFRSLKEQTHRDIGWRGGRKEDALLRSDGTWWYWAGEYHKGIHRHLNWFGVLGKSRGVSIAVEVNVPHVGNQPSVAGFFAKRVEDGAVFLCHSGNLGGGKPGMKRDAFLAHSNLRPISVLGANSKPREGVIVMPVKGNASRLAAIDFLQRVSDFKAAVDRGETTTPEAVKKQIELRDYYDEAFGRRRGKRKHRIVDYTSRHGEVVKALHEWRAGAGIPHRTRLVKNVYLDLGLARGKRLQEAYEVKTSLARPDIYAGIGQLLVHGADSGCSRFLVLPKGRSLDPAISKALKQIDIGLIRFDASKDVIRIG